MTEDSIIEPSFSIPDGLDRAPILKLKGPEREQTLAEHKLSEDEYDSLRNILGRDPTYAELGVFSSMWSEHCSYKSSRVHLKKLPTEGPQVVVGPGENAGVVSLSGDLCAVFKMESHNHPSYLEPYQGAATGVGGILRDVFCMGARPVANLNALRFGRCEHSRTPYLLEYVVKGIGDYGNCVGIPTVAGNVSFDRSYDSNCLVNAMTVGIIHRDRIFKGYASGTGNLVVYVGSSTGRDGIHGATMASDSFASSGGSSKTTVQVGDPFTEKMLLEATLEVLDKDLVVGLQDMGAAGLTSSSFEMASRAGTGLFLDLSRVPVRTSKMTAYELLLSESQERMLMVVKPEKWSELRRTLEKWELSCAIIGVVTGDGRVRASLGSRLEIDIPVGPVTEQAPRYDRPQKPVPLSPMSEPMTKSLADGVRSAAMDLLPKILSRTGSKRPLYRQYDQHIGNRTVLGPESGGAAVLWMRTPWQDQSAPYLGLATTTSCAERMCSSDPQKGAALAVVQSARMIAAAGGVPLAITDCLNFGNPEDPEVMWEFSEAISGLKEACQHLQTPVVSGNVSLYNETDGRSISPTPMVGMVGRVDDVRNCKPAVIRQGGDFEIFWLRPRTGLDLYGSVAADLLGICPSRQELPEIDWQYETQAIAAVRRLSQVQGVWAVRAVGNGGVLAALAKMALSNDEDAAEDAENSRNRGLDVTIPDAVSPESLFADISGGYLLIAQRGTRLMEESAAEGSTAASTAETGWVMERLGASTNDGRLTVGQWQWSLAELSAGHRAGLGL